MYFSVCVFLYTVRSPEGKLSLYCKGADTIIYERLHQSCSKLMDVTTDHLNVSDISLCFDVILIHLMLILLFLLVVWFLRACVLALSSQVKCVYVCLEIQSSS